MTFEAFVENVERLIETQPEKHRLAAEVEQQLKELLRHPDFLAEEFRQPGANEPRSHVVYVSPEKTFSVVSFVWSPGQSTCVHDHVCWCIVGVLQGLEQETRFQLRQNGSNERWLKPLGGGTLEPGHTCALVPPEEDIHQVTNAGTGTAISIHVYGADIGKLGTSINHRFDLPIRSDDQGSAVNWRDVVAG